jgi:GT2 family glycosyltransferase
MTLEATEFLAAAKTPGSITLSVVVPTRNRRDVLGRLLQSIAAQDRADVEVIVVDDASERAVTDEALDVMAPASLRPRVRVLRLPTPAGACAARNAGTAAARGRHVLYVDDDVELVGSDLCTQLIDLADANPDVGVIGLAELAPDGGWGFNLGPPGPPLEVARFHGCGALFRRACFDQVGGYFAPLRYYYEEFEISMRVIDAGWRIVFVPDLQITHFRDPRGRDGRGIMRLIFRNATMTIFARFPIWTVPAAVAGQFCRFAYACWCSNSIDGWGPFIAGKDVLRMLPVTLRSRRAVRTMSLLRYKRLARHPIPWIAAAARSVEAP